jgi:hypothetical protein
MGKGAEGLAISIASKDEEQDSKAYLSQLPLGARSLPPNAQSRKRGRVEGKPNRGRLEARCLN